MLLEPNFSYFIADISKTKTIEILNREYAEPIPTNSDFSVFLGRNVNQQIPKVNGKKILIVIPDILFWFNVENNPLYLSDYDYVVVKTSIPEEVKKISGLCSSTVCALPDEYHFDTPFFSEMAVAVYFFSKNREREIIINCPEFYQKHPNFLKKYKRHKKSKEMQIFDKLIKNKKLRI